MRPIISNARGQHARRPLRRIPNGNPKVLPGRIRNPGAVVQRRGGPQESAAAAAAPGTHQPIGPEALAPLFPMELIKQEVSTERYIADPGRGARDLPHLAAVAAVSARAASRRRSIRRRTSTTSTKASARRLAQAEHRRRAGLLQQAGGRDALATETGAGQWGSSLAFACQIFGIECKVYMVRSSTNRSRIGAR